MIDFAERASNQTGLLPIETGRVDDLLNLFRIRFGKVLGTRPTGEQHRSDLVYVFVGGLGRKDRGYEELPRVHIVEGGGDIRVKLPQPIEDDSGVATLLDSRLGRAGI